MARQAVRIAADSFAVAGYGQSVVGDDSVAINARQRAQRTVDTSARAQPHPDKAGIAHCLLPSAVATVQYGAACNAVDMRISRRLQSPAGAAFRSDGGELLDGAVFIAAGVEGLDQEEPGIWHELDVMMTWGIFINGSA